MKSSLSILFLLLIYCIESSGQSLGFKWSTSLYGSGIDYSYSVAHPSGDFNYIIGSTNSVDHDYPPDSNIGRRIFLARIDSNGAKEFVRIVEGLPSDSTIILQKMISTYDGDLIAVGYIHKIVSSGGYNKDLFLMKIDTAANLIWYKHYGGSLDDEGYDIIEINNNYVIAGYSKSNDGDVGMNYGSKDCWIFKIDSSGNTIWSTVSGGNNDDYANSLLSDSTNLFVLATSSSTNYGIQIGGEDMVLLTLNMAGQVLQNKHFGGSSDDDGIKILRNNTGNLILAGSSRSNNGNITGQHGLQTYDLVLLKLNSSLNIIASHCYGGVLDEKLDDAYFDGNTYYLLGSADSSDGDIGFNYGYSDFWLCTTDTLFNVTGSFVFGGSGDDDYSDVIYGGKSTIIKSKDGIFFSGISRSSDGTVFPEFPGNPDIYFGDIKLCGSTPQIVTNFPAGNSLICYGDTVILSDSACQSCTVVWKDCCSLLDTIHAINTGGGYYYWVKAIDQCEAVYGPISILSEEPNYYYKEISFNENQYESFSDIERVNDSCLIALGYTNGNFYLSSFKNDSLIWEKLYGGSSADFTSKLLLVKNPLRYYLYGSTSSNDGDINYNHGGYDGWIVKVDSDGDLIQQKTFGGSQSDFIAGMIQVNDNRFIAVGGTESTDGDLSTNYGGGDAWVIMIDSDFNVIWSKNYGGSLDDEGYSAVKVSNNKILIYGFTMSNDIDVPENKGVTDLWVFTVDTLGNLIWSKTFGSSQNDYFFNEETLLYAKNAIFITAYTYGTDGDFISDYGIQNTWLLKLDTSGNIIWKKDFAGNLGEYNPVMTVDDSENIIITMISSSHDGLINLPTNDLIGYVIFKIDSSGNILKKKDLLAEPVVPYSSTIYSVNHILDMKNNTVSIAGSKEVSGNYDFWIENLSLDDPEIKVISEDTLPCANSVALAIETCSGCSLLWSNGETLPQISISSPGTYYVTISSNTPCSSITDSITLSFNAAPLPPIITQVNDTLFSSYQSNNQWYLNGSAITGAVNPFLVLTDFGCFQVAHSDSNGCTSFSDTLCVIATNTDQLKNTTLHSQPNPFEGNIVIDGSGWNGTVRLQLIDMYGRCLRNELISSSSNNLVNSWNLSGLGAGIYFLEVTDHFKSQTIQIVKQ